jgi:hypothetical protein
MGSYYIPPVNFGLIEDNLCVPVPILRAGARRAAWAGSVLWCPLERNVGET